MEDVEEAGGEPAIDLWGDVGEVLRGVAGGGHDKGGSMGECHHLFLLFVVC